MEKLSQQDRLRLMKFICSFAWADLEVKDAERAFVRRMAKKLRLTDAEMGQVEEWLALPPRAEEVDPNQVPTAHRKMFLDAIRQVVTADGEVSQEEWESLTVLEQLLEG